MPGAGSHARRHLHQHVAPKDGTSIGALMPGAIIGPLLDDKPNLQFDPDQGELYRHRRFRRARLHDLPEFQDQDLRGRAEEQDHRRRSAAGGATRDYAYLHNHTAGTKFDVVSGYQGTVDIALAMERGEVDGMCGWDWSSVKSQKSDWVRDKKINVLVQVSLEPSAGADRDGRAAHLEIRHQPGGPPGGGAGRQPAGVPALLHRAAGHADAADRASCARPSTPP